MGDDLVILFDHIQYACKRIAALVASPFNSSLGRRNDIVGGVDGGTGRDAPKPLDIVSVGFLTTDWVPTSLVFARHCLPFFELNFSIFLATSFLNLVMFGILELKYCCLELRSVSIVGCSHVSLNCGINDVASNRLVQFLFLIITSLLLLFLSVSSSPICILVFPSEIHSHKSPVPEDSCKLLLVFPTPEA